jgi:hypothetical protein
VAYSKQIRNILLSPKNGPKCYKYNGKGYNLVEERCRSNQEKQLKNKIVFKIFVEEGIIIESRWEVFGDPVAVAACVWSREKIRGCHLSKLNKKLILEQMLLDLEITNKNDINSGCLAVLGAIAKAVDDYNNYNVPL